jgi:hypothetical protein
MCPESDLGKSLRNQFFCLQYNVMIPRALRSNQSEGDCLFCREQRDPVATITAIVFSDERNPSRFAKQSSFMHDC